MSFRRPGDVCAPVRRRIEGLGIIVPLQQIIWLRVYYNKIPIHPVFHLLKGDYNPNIDPIIIP